MTKREKLSIDGFVGKCDWKGGLHELASYGLKPDDIADKQLANLWSDYLSIYNNLTKKADEINAYTGCD